MLTAGKLDSLMEYMKFPNRRLKVIEIAGERGVNFTGKVLHTILQNSGYLIGWYSMPKGAEKPRLELNGECRLDQACTMFGQAVDEACASLGAEKLTPEERFELIAINYFAKEGCPDLLLWNKADQLNNSVDQALYPILAVLTDGSEQFVAQYVEMHPLSVPIASGLRKAETIAVIDDWVKEKRNNHYLLKRDYRSNLAYSMGNDLLIHVEGPYRKIDNIPVVSGNESDIWSTTVAVMASELLRQHYAILIEDNWHGLNSEVHTS